MKKLILLVLVVLGASIFAAPADNFKKAGIGISGQLSCIGQVDDVFEDAEDKGAYTSLTIRPKLDFFLMDNFSSYIAPTYKYLKNSYFSGTDFYTTSHSKVGVDVGFSYFFTDIGDLVPYIGAYTSVDYKTSHDDEVNGVEFENNSTYFDFEYGVHIGTLYFLTDNIALDFSGQFSLSEDTQLTSSSGDKYIYASDYKLIDNLDLNTYFFFGLSVYFPKDVSRLIISK